MGMTKRERIKAALAGKTVVRVPIGFWRHWLGDDQLAKSLAQVTLKFQQQCDLDFIKILVTSTYCVEDYRAGLTEAKKLFRGALMGGIEQYKILNFGNPADVESQVHDAINLTKGSRMIITPGCTYPLSVPHFNLLAMRNAVDNYHEKRECR